tara:strand:- start:261 stop:1004 length:744 start_codon:yes stop_codon:yes gene_type:complete
MISRWTDLNLDKYKRDFQSNSPKHIIMDNLLNKNVIRKIEDEMDQNLNWGSDEHNNSKHKQFVQNINDMPLWIKNVCKYFNSKEFTDKLSYITGYKNIIADNSFSGGGCHRTLSGGFLNVHHDYTNFDSFMGNWDDIVAEEGIPKIAGQKLYRHLNLLIYINEEWLPEWGGNLEIWSNDLKEIIKEVEFKQNNSILFAIDGVPHGYPTPIKCPKDVARKSLAFYYFTTEPTLNNYERAFWKNGEELR